MRDKIEQFFKFSERLLGLAAICMTLGSFGVQTSVANPAPLMPEWQQTTSHQDTTAADSTGQVRGKQDMRKPLQQVKTDTLSRSNKKQQTAKRHESTMSMTEIYSAGLEQLQSGDAQGAATSFEKVLLNDPAHVPSLINLARAYIELEEYDKAENLVDGAIASDSTNADAYRVRGRVMQATGDTDEAIASYKMSIRLDEHNPFAYNNLALIYIRDGRFSEAIPLLEKAVERKNDVAFFYNNLGIAYEGAGNLKEAEESFQQAMTVDPGYQKALTNLDRVKTTLAEKSVSNGKAGQEPNTGSGQKSDSVQVKEINARKDSTTERR